ncbi:MAG: hypothetical protein NTW06_04835 [Candidatus Falkowbacteria bacterium]|nr:hypothetical protein [Candidatus Falkowbacteria bacterium]
MARKQGKKSVNKKTKKNEKDKIAQEIKQVTDELILLAKAAKKKYDKVDEKTKQQVVAGIVGAATLIATAVGINKLRRGKK